MRCTALGCSVRSVLLFTCIHALLLLLLGLACFSRSLALSLSLSLLTLLKPGGPFWTSRGYRPDEHTYSRANLLFLPFFPLLPSPPPTPVVALQLQLIVSSCKPSNAQIKSRPGKIVVSYDETRVQKTIAYAAERSLVLLTVNVQALAVAGDVVPRDAMQSRSISYAVRESPSTGLMLRHSSGRVPE